MIESTNHPDDLDKAVALAELEREVAAKVRKPSPPKRGRCLICDEPVGPEAQFCGRPCRDEFEDSRRR